MKNKVIFSLLFLFVTAIAFSQQLVDAEKQLQIDFKELKNTIDDSTKVECCKKIEQHLLKALKDNASFDYSFDLLKRMGKFRSPDNKFRLYNWSCEFSDGTYRYFGIIQSKYNKEWKTEVLNDCKKPDMFQQNSANTWAGAIYYQIIPFQSRRQQVYLLLGWDGNNLTSNKKIIETLCFDKTGAVVFGRPFILWRKKMLNRVVFEYAERAGMKIIYQPNKKRIVFNHLEPIAPKYKNQYDYYAPDFSFDALVLKRGIWQMIEDVNPQN